MGGHAEPRAGHQLSTMSDEALRPMTRPTGCRICGGKLVERFQAHEHVYGTREVFQYGQCGECRCLQILQLDFDLAPFYRSAYGPLVYSALKRRIRGIAYWIVYNRIPGSRLLGLMFPFFHAGVISALRQYAGKEDSVLDVGSGYGRFLSGLRSIGFEGSLDGIDPFLPGDSQLADGVRLRGMDISSVSERYDVITCIHTLEHISDPEGFFRAIPRLLTDRGVCILSIPVADSAAWHRYGCDWVQMDPPRHLFLHTEASIRHLAEGVRLTVHEIVWNSTSFRYWGSALVKRRTPIAPFWRSYLRSIWRIVPDTLRAWRANRTAAGDQATFVLTR